MMDIQDEARHILHQRDVFSKQIVSFSQPAQALDPIVLTKKDGSTQSVYAVDQLQQLKIGEIPSTSLLYCPSTKQNVEWLVTYWRDIATTDVRITFITQSKSNWTIKPKIHQMLLGAADHAKGIWSLYENNI